MFTMFVCLFILNEKLVFFWGGEEVGNKKLAAIMFPLVSLGRRKKRIERKN
jgi:hypothetical protein